MARTFVFLSLLLSTVGLSAQQPGPPVDFAGTIKAQYTQNKGYLLASAEKWPADQYNWRPAGLESELRTFGQILVHLANENNQQCSRVLGRPTPMPLDDSKAAYTKAQATKALTDALALCDPVYAGLTNQNIIEMISIPGRGNTTRQVPRATQLVANVAHSNEQYGMIMIYFGMKGMVPPSHEPRNGPPPAR